MKLTELASNPGHCREVMASLSGATLGESQKISIQTMGPVASKFKLLVLKWSYHALFIWEDGAVIYEKNREVSEYNPFTLVKLLTELGYTPEP